VSDLDASYSVVTKEGDVYKVDKIWTDPILDIAILHIVDKNNLPVHDLKPAKIIDFNANVDIGQFVIAIGNALAEYSDTVTFGILSAK
jgi:S1-C subfamily serine protease